MNIIIIINKQNEKRIFDQNADDFDVCESDIAAVI